MDEDDDWTDLELDRDEWMNETDFKIEKEVVVVQLIAGLILAYPIYWLVTQVVHFLAGY